MRRLMICSVVLLPALKPACSSALISACGINMFSMIFSMTLLWWLMRLTVWEFWHYCSLLFLGSVITKEWVHRVGHSAVCQSLWQIVVRAVMTSSPSAWTSSAGMLSTPADFSFFSDCTAASTSLWRMGWLTSVCVCLGTIQCWWISICIAIAQLRAVFCLSVQYLILLWGIFLQSLNVLPLRPGVGQYTAMHATLTARDFFLAYFYTSGPFTCIFPKPFPISPVLAVANTWFLCGPAE